MDFTVYVALSLVPLLSERQGAGPVMLALIPVCSGVAYTITAWQGGRISDRFSRTAVARAGLLTACATFAVFFFATKPWHYWFGLPVVAVGLALFWPALQAAVADESCPRTLTKNLGIFNVAWAGGKGLGVLAGGVLLDPVGRGGFLIAAAIGLSLLVFLPRVPTGGGRGLALAPDGATVPRREAFRVSALIANFAAYGLATTIINLYPDLNHELGRGGVSYGVVVGAVFLAQTASFGLLAAFPSWPYRKTAQIVPQCLAAGGAALMATGLPVAAVLPGAVAVGVGLGTAYFASIYYSLHADASRGGRAGLHEAILGGGNLIVPLLGGTLAGLLRAPWAPGVFAGAVVLAAVALQVVTLRRSRLESAVPGGAAAEGSR